MNQYRFKMPVGDGAHAITQVCDIDARPKAKSYFGLTQWERARIMQTRLAERIDQRRQARREKFKALRARSKVRRA